MFDSLIPVVGVVTAVVVLREAPLAWHLIGGTLVVAGVWLALWEPKQAVVPIVIATVDVGGGWHARPVMETHASRREPVLT
jgi:hypothetical protein